MFLGDGKLGGMWPIENQLLCLNYIIAHFILLSPVTNMSELFSQGAFGMPRNQ